MTRFFLLKNISWIVFVYFWNFEVFFRQTFVNSLLIFLVFLDVPDFLVLLCQMFNRRLVVLVRLWTTILKICRVPTDLWGVDVIFRCTFVSMNYWLLVFLSQKLLKYLEFLLLNSQKIGLELFEKYKIPILSINIRFRQLKSKIHTVNIKS